MQSGSGSVPIIAGIAYSDCGSKCPAEQFHQKCIENKRENRNYNGGIKSSFNSSL